MDPITHTLINEKIDRLESQVEALTKTVNEFIAIKHKALGVFWLGSLIITAAVMAAVSSISGWMRGH